MVGTNDLVNLSAAEMTKSIKSLCDWILASILDYNIIVSEIVRREDKKFLNGKVSELNRALKMMNMDILRQQNITRTHLGKKVLNLNFEGNRQLAKNIMESFEQYLYSNEFYSYNDGEGLDPNFVINASSI